MALHFDFHRFITLPARRKQQQQQRGSPYKSCKTAGRVVSFITTLKAYMQITSLLRCIGKARDDPIPSTRRLAKQWTPLGTEAAAARQLLLPAFSHSKPEAVHAAYGHRNYVKRNYSARQIFPTATTTQQHF